MVGFYVSLYGVVKIVKMASGSPPPEPVKTPLATAVANATGVNPAACRCVRTDRLRNDSYLDALRVGAVVEFTGTTATTGKQRLPYTLHMPTPEISGETPAYESPLRQGDSPTKTSVDALTGAPLALQLAIDSALLGGQSIAIGVAVDPARRRSTMEDVAIICLIGSKSGCFVCH